jgi:ribosomal protein S18 acetylase RimI-like enzyme
METMIKIRSARPSDALDFPLVEQSAGELFRTIEDLAWIADSENLTDPQYVQLIQQGASWVAQTQGDQLVGFLCAEITGEDLHIHELAVVLEFQRRGIGRRLLDTAAAWAVGRDLSGVTLTTFREVAWNEPFYASVGFETLCERRMTPHLAATMKFEIERGLPANRRCSMRRPLDRKAKRSGWR